MLTTRTSSGDRPLEHFVHGVVRPRTLVGTDESSELRVVFVTFEPGARNLWHTHGFDQGLLITDGAGIIATEGEQREVRAGDFVLITAGERHWHGAAPDEPMAHLAVGIPGTTDFDGAAYTATE